MKKFRIGHSSSVATKEACIIAIPPHSYKLIDEFTIAEDEILDCDLVRYPSEKSSIIFSVEDSPITFTNYITYNFGEDTKDIAIQNEFYVSDVTNYPKPSITTYTERSQTCENVLTPTEVKNQKNRIKVYDAYVTIPSDGYFYIQYDVTSKDHLYKRGISNYYWNSTYNGYTSSQESSSSKYGFPIPHK